jgi:hypothetical protein
MINLDQIHIAHDIQWNIKKEKLKNIAFRAFIGTGLTFLLILALSIASHI